MDGGGQRGVMHLQVLLVTYTTLTVLIRIKKKIKFYERQYHGDIKKNITFPSKIYSGSIHSV